jgi:hypothetical protein
MQKKGELSNSLWGVGVGVVQAAMDLLLLRHRR